MNRLIDIKVVEHSTGLKKSAIYERISDGRFPSPIKIGRASRWSSEEIDRWIEAALMARGAA